MADVLSSLLATGTCGLFLVGGGIAAGGVSQRLLSGESLAGRLAAVCVLWHVLLVVLALPLLQMGMFSYKIAIGIYAVAAVLIIWRTWDAALKLFRDVAHSCAALDTAGLVPWQRGIVWLAAGTLLCALARGMILPPLSWDSLIYHLWLPAEWVRTNGFFLFHAPENWDTCQFFPLNWEVVAAWMFRCAGDDRFINLINYIFLMQMFCAFFGLCRQFGIASSRAYLGGLALCFNASIFTYVNTAYVENAMTAHLLTGYLFLFRALEARGRALQGMAAAAFGLAVGTKLVALPHLAGVAVAFAYIFISEHRRPARPVVTAVALMSVFLATSSFWYLRTWMHTGSPLYPYGLTISGVRIFPESAKHAKYGAYLVEKAVELSRSVQMSKVTPFLPILPLATTCGPLALFLAPLVPGGLLAMVKKGGWLRTGMLVAGAAFTLTGYYSDRMFPIRFFWADSASRFLLFPLVLMLISAIRRLPDIRRPVTVERTIWGCIVISLAFQIPQAWDAGMKMINWMMYMTMIGMLFYGARSTSGCFAGMMEKGRGRAIVAVLTGWCLLTPFIQSALRAHSLEYAYELHHFPREQAPAWRFCDRPERPLRISMSVGFDGRGGNNWFMYPLMGGKLQNSVFYTPISASGEIIDSFMTTPEDVLRRGDRTAWLDRLQQTADYLILCRPFPPEASWAAEASDTLRPVAMEEHVRIYEIRHSP